MLNTMKRAVCAPTNVTEAMQYYQKPCSDTW